MLSMRGVQQRYVSNELTHFVGAGLANSSADLSAVLEDQYNLLIKIIGDRRISYPPHDQEDDIPEGLEYDPGCSYTFYGRFDASSNDLISPDIVCFCDIPIGDLGIHIQKYSPFGLSFLKSFLIKRGANPVFYVARSSEIHGTTRAEYFDKNIKIYLKTCANANLETPSGNDCHSINGFFSHLLCYLKFFDPEKADDDKDNFYMEREWRSQSNINFKIKDIERIIIPKSFAQKFRYDVPDYLGQLTFSDDHISKLPLRDAKSPTAVCTPGKPLSAP